MNSTNARSHGRAARRAAFCLFAVLLASGSVGATTAEAKRYSADRFDSRIEVLPDGSLRVTETVVFRFESGTFREVFRELPTRRTDGIEIERATMDGLEFPRGTDAGQVEVRQRRRVRVTWRFAPVSETTHSFELTYLIRGAVRENAEADILLVRVLPGQRRYRIASSTTDILLPTAPIALPVIERRRVGHAEAAVDGTHVRVDAEGISANGRLDVEVRLPRGSALDGPPAWQARERLHAEHSPQWIAAGGGAFALSLFLIFAVRQGYHAPKHDYTVATTGPALPDSLAPAEAGALVTNGGARFEHAMATLFSLAERGEISIVESARGAFGQRRYTVTRRAARRPAASYEEALLEAIFAPKGRTEESVPLDKARSRVLGGFKRFRGGLETELRVEGLFDDARKRVRNRFARLGTVLILIAALLPLPLVLLLEDAFGLWPLLVPLGLGLGGIVALIAHAAHTPLSNEGLRRARYWRGFREYLRDVTGNDAAPPADSHERLLAYAVALGLATRWAKYLKDHRIEAPPWFHAESAGESSPAFIAFIAAGGATAGSGGAGGAAVGGGASGAR
ncbi:hypothetical protein BH23ACI1_BH23ACI1_02580 [soil metagenome]